MPPIERICAPLTVLGLHALLLGDVVSHRLELLQFGSPLVFVEWTTVFLALFAYLCTVTSDPGFLRPDQSKAVRPPCPLKVLGWLATAVLSVVSLAARGLQRQAASLGKESPKAGSTAGDRGARELRTIGRPTLDLGGSHEESDPGEETIDPADIEAGGSGGTLVTGQSPKHSTSGASEGHDAIGSGRSLGAVPGSPRPGSGWKRREAQQRPTDLKRAVVQSGHRLRFCRICAMHQPLRTKHCRDCGRCVRTHDHHCPWVGTCVGEGNRLYFCWYLVAQCIELIVFFIEGLRCLLKDGWTLPLWVIRFPGLVLGLVVMAMFLTMVFCLLCFHSYLAMVNLTTWESMSWHHISYLRSLPPEEGSPFSTSLRSNLAVYCCPPWCPTGASRCRGDSQRDLLKRTEDGWAVWDLSEPSQPLDLDCDCCGCGHCVVCPCFDADDAES